MSRETQASAWGGGGVKVRGRLKTVNPDLVLPLLDAYAAPTAAKADVIVGT